MDQRGMTLMELNVVILLLVIVFTMFAPMLDLSVRNLGQRSAESVQQDAVLLVQAHLKQRLQASREWRTFGASTTFTFWEGGAIHEARYALEIGSVLAYYQDGEADARRRFVDVRSLGFMCFEDGGPSTFCPLGRRVDVAITVMGDAIPDRVAAFTVRRRVDCQALDCPVLPP